MWRWWRTKPAPEPAVPAADRIRAKYRSFRELLTLNSECLELMASLQEDLQFVPPRRDVLDTSVSAVFDKVELTISALERLWGAPQPTLVSALGSQRHEVERHIASLQELAAPRLSASLEDVGAQSVAEAGGKAALLGEIGAKLNVPVPPGYVITTESYRQFCGIPLWKSIRDALRDLDFNDADALQSVSRHLADEVLRMPLPRAVEVAITERANALMKFAPGLAVRSSAVGEGGARTYAGQFTSFLNVRHDGLLEAYKQVVAGRFSDRALFYRLSTGLSEADSPMAVLFLPVIDARASGIMYTRDPADPKSKTLWITSTWGLGVNIASGRMPADLFLVSRGRTLAVLDSTIANKEEEVGLGRGGGLETHPLPADLARRPSLDSEQLATLANYGLRIEELFRVPQDIEWVLDRAGQFWIVQSRPLALIEATKAWSKTRIKDEPRLAGGRTVYPGRVSGPAFLAGDLASIARAPAGSVVFVHRPSPEIVGMLPRIAGFVAEWGNVAGHAAALLREFRVPSVFEMRGAFELLKSGDAVSFDSVQAKVYLGTLWPPRKPGHKLISARARSLNDPIGQRLLALNLVDAAGANFKPSGCKSAHDILRYCHEKSIEAMFAVGDIVLEKGLTHTRDLVTALPLHIRVLDLGGGVSAADTSGEGVTPSEIVSRPFQSLWKGIAHPGVSWTREMPTSLSDLASVLASSLTPRDEPFRPLGEKSYLLAARDYMNLNSRLAYHFSLVDSSVSDTPSENYISFRFAGGGTTGERRSLRACFIERCLVHYGYQVDRRGDLVNAWFRKAPAEVMEEKLDILGRLLACSSQLDMYMTSLEVMQWYVRQFLEGNYAFKSG